MSNKKKEYQIQISVGGKLVAFMFVALPALALAASFAYVVWRVW